MLAQSGKQTPTYAGKKLKTKISILWRGGKCNLLFSFHYSCLNKMETQRNCEICIFLKCAIGFKVNGVRLLSWGINLCAAVPHRYGRLLTSKEEAQ